MFSNSKYPINHDWDAYYEILESIRISGITNMWGAATYLADWVKSEENIPNISEKQASEILCSWIGNYDTLAEYFEWRTHYYIDTDLVNKEAFKIYLAHCLMTEAVNEAKRLGELDFIEYDFQRAFAEAGGIFEHLSATGVIEVVDGHDFKITHS